MQINASNGNVLQRLKRLKLLITKKGFAAKFSIKNLAKFNQVKKEKNFSYNFLKNEFILFLHEKLFKLDSSL